MNIPLFSAFLAPHAWSAYFETPLYLRQRLPEVSDAFSDIFSDGSRLPPNLVPEQGQDAKHAYDLDFIFQCHIKGLIRGQGTGYRILCRNYASTRSKMFSTDS